MCTATRTVAVLALACIAPAAAHPSWHSAALNVPSAFAPFPALSTGLCAEARPGTCLTARDFKETPRTRRCGGKRLSALRAMSEDDAVDKDREKEDVEDDMGKFNAEIYSELRDHFAVSAEAPTIASKRGGSEVFTYMPPSFHDREATQRLLPSPEFTPQEVISTILQAMKANRKFGCSIYLRFMSDKHEYSRLTAEDLQVLRLATQSVVQCCACFISHILPWHSFNSRWAGRRRCSWAISGEHLLNTLLTAASMHWLVSSWACVCVCVPAHAECIGACVHAAFPTTQVGLHGSNSTEAQAMLRR